MLSRKQERFLRDDLRRINLLYGSVRSGKTWISLLKWALWVGLQPKNKKFLMVGKTLTTLKRNCLDLLPELVGDNFKCSISAKKASIFGRTVWLEGANDERSESKIRGMTLQGAYIDELTQIPETFYLMVLSRLSERGAALIATTNPDAPNHYVKTEIIDNDVIDKQVIKFMLDDNDFLDEDYKNNLKKEYTGVFYDRFILGEFVRAEGIIFPEFANNPKPWIISAEEVPKEFRRVISGLDVGGNGSHHSMCCTGEGYDGNYYVLKCIDVDPVGTNMLDIENMVVDFCKDIENKYNCEVEFINSDWVDVVINSINDNTPYRCGKCYKPPLDDRPLTISRLFNTHQLKFVNGMCDPLIDELRNVVYDDKSDRAVIQDNGSMCIDCVDAFVYSFNNWNYLTAN